MLSPKPLPNESPQAFAAFKEYVALGNKRSIKAVGRRCGKHHSLIERWSVKHRWQQRLRELETQAALQANEAHRDAEAKAKLEEARQIERLRTQHVKRMMQQCEKMGERLDQMLALPVVKSQKVEEVKDGQGNVIKQTINVYPAKWDYNAVARLLQTLDMQTRLALGMPISSHEITGKDGAPLNPCAAPIINLVIHRDEESDRIRLLQYKFAKEHPDHPQAARFIAELDTEYRERGLSLDEDDDELPRNGE
jgi:vacuolar-type H+-ATPase subunit E/Vma4